jgi:hypothetical protein
VVLCTAMPYCTPADWIRHGFSTLCYSPDRWLRCGVGKPVGRARPEEPEQAGGAAITVQPCLRKSARGRIVSSLEIRKRFANGPTWHRSLPKRSQGRPLQRIAV